MEAFDLAGARCAAEEGRLVPWFDAVLKWEPGANRNLAAILRGHAPLLETPFRIPLDELTQGAGPGPEFRWPKEPARWNAEVEAIAAFAPEALPPILFRETAGERHLSDGNHRLDAWRRRGETHGWAVVWRDRDPRFAGCWSPFLPERTPRIEPVAGRPGETTIAALVGDRTVGLAQLSVDEEGAELTLTVDPEWRGLRLGARLLHRLQPHLDGRVVYLRAHPRQTRFYGEFGFLPASEPKGDELLLCRDP